MTALSASRLTLHQGQGETRRYPQDNAGAIYKGGLVMINSAGYAVAAADAASGKVVGVAIKDYAAPTNDGDNDVEVLVGVFKLVASSITQAMVGTMMFVVDDQTFDDGVGTNGVKAGILVRYESTTSGWILIPGDPLGVASVLTNGSAIAGTAASTSTADADATYGQPEADLINELKADMNTNATMLTEVKTSLNLVILKVAEIATIVKHLT
ncbi:MAG: hypothetical protein RL139_902 [Gemmatimonadota bacterium]|jgi:hypothetical protein